MDAPRPWPTEQDLIDAAPHFDAKHYLAAQPDVGAVGMDPLLHFLAYGWWEGRDPSASFSLRYYLGRHPDVAAAGINPLLHYARAGWREGRQTLRPLDALRRQLDLTRAPSLRAAEWLGAADVTAAIAAAEVAGRLPAASPGRGLILSVSHDDYAANYGGVQNLVGVEQRGFGRRDWDYLHLCPAAPIPLLAGTAEPEAYRIKLRLNGEALGPARLVDLIDIVAARRAAGQRVELIVHHFLGQAPELLGRLAEAARARPIVWLHDFFTLCTSYALLRNDVVFCDAPPPASAACSVCSYGPDRRDHAPRIAAFFAAHHPVVVAPSAVTLDLWRARSNLPHAASHVVAPGRLLLADAVPPPAAEDGKLRVAHLATRTTIKGWPIFQELALRFAAGPYNFFQLGDPNGPPLPGVIRNVPVRVTRQSPAAMIEAIAWHRIDIVISWSLWPESFCFAAHEALAGGAFVLAREAAGNVAPAMAAAAPRQSRALPDVAALHALFENGEILEISRAAQRRRGTLLPSIGTAELLGRPETALPWPAWRQSYPRAAA